MWTEELEILDKSFSAAFYVHDIQDLADNLRVLHQNPITAEFDVGVDDYFIYETEIKYRTASAAIRADQLASLFHRNRLNLFRQNPRYYLSGRTIVNKKILDTLGSDDPSNFYLYNNGITAVCSSVRDTKIPTGVRLVAEDFQIVNGCQTTATIYEAWRSGAGTNAMTQVRVPIRFVETQSAPTLASIIARTTNDQNPIRAEDFRSGDPVHIRLQREFDMVRPRWFYEFKRGTWVTEYRTAQAKSPYVGEPYAPRRIQMKDLAQSCLAFLSRPAEAADRAAFIFVNDDLYNRVFPQGITAVQLLLPHLLYLEADRITRANSSKYQWSTAYLRYPIVYCVTQLMNHLLGRTGVSEYFPQDQSAVLIESMSSWSKDLFDTSFNQLALQVEEESAGGVGVRAVVRRLGWLETPIMATINRISIRLETEAQVAVQQEVPKDSLGLRANFPFSISD